MGVARSNIRQLLSDDDEVRTTEGKAIDITNLEKTAPVLQKHGLPQL